MDLSIHCLLSPPSELLKLEYSKKGVQKGVQRVPAAKQPLAQTQARTRFHRFKNKNGGGGENRTRVQRHLELSHYKFSSVFCQNRWQRPERPPGVAIMS
jgi:hypothetical protein